MPAMSISIPTLITPVNNPIVDAIVLTVMDNPMVPNRHRIIKSVNIVRPL